MSVENAQPAVEPAVPEKKSISERMNEFVAQQHEPPASAESEVEAEDRTGGEAPFTGDEGTDLADEAEEKISDPEDEEEPEELSKSQKKRRESAKRLRKKLDLREAEIQQYHHEARKADELMYQALDALQERDAEIQELRGLLSEYQIDHRPSPEALRIRELEREAAARQRQDEYARVMQRQSENAQIMRNLEDSALEAGVSLQDLAGRLQGLGYGKPGKLLSPDIMRKEAAELARLTGVPKVASPAQAQARANKNAPAPTRGGTSGTTTYQKQPGERDYTGAMNRFLTDLKGGHSQ